MKVLKKIWQSQLSQQQLPLAPSPWSSRWKFKPLILLRSSLGPHSYCGATSQFMDCNYVQQNRLTIWKLQHAIPVFNMDGSPNEAGSITEIIDAILCYKGHTEHTSFAVTSLGKQDIILRFTWLQEHNLEINWRTQEVAMS